MRPGAGWWAVLAFAAGSGCTTIVGLDGVTYTGGAGGTGGGTAGAGGETGGAGGTTTTTGTTSTGGSGCTIESDGKQCTEDTCGPDGGPVHTPLPAGTSCSEDGGKLCNAAGSCVVCLVDADCGQDSLICNTAAGTCGPKPPGCGDGSIQPNEECDDGNGGGGDGCSGACTVEFGYTCKGQPSACETLCGDGLAAASEGCDDGNVAAGDGCSAACTVEPGYACAGAQPSVCVPVCGDGVLTAGEQCDDDNTAAGDGCSAACAVEPFHQCTGGAPSVCTKREVLCDDRDDNDDDGLFDKEDPDCKLPAWFDGCGAGAELRVYKATDLPLSIPDAVLTGVTSTIFVPESATIERVAVVFSVTHPQIGDLSLALTRPSGATFTLLSNVGASGDDFTNTVLDPDCNFPLLFGFAPYSGCYTPQASLGQLSGTQAKGVWKLSAIDGTAGMTGTFDAWTLVLCTD